MAAPANAQEGDDETHGSPASSRAASPPTAERSAGPSARPQLESGFELQRGGTWSLFYGYGFPHRINGSAEQAIASGGIRYSHVGALRGSGPLRGHPSFGLEVLPAMAFLPVRGERGADSFGAGGNLLYEHRFAPRGRWMPVWRVGAGTVYTNREVPAGEERLNFSLLTGLGVDVQLSRGGALSLEYRFHHVSNAGRGPVNPGINTHTLLLGYSFYR